MHRMSYQLTDDFHGDYCYCQSNTEDAGCLLSVIYDGYEDSSYVAVVDAQRFNEGVIAKIHFGQALPISFHCNWMHGT